MLAFEQAGSGLPVVFLHAFPLHRGMWSLIRDSVSRRHRFISVDLPGFGESSEFPEINSMGSMASELHSTLSQIAPSGDIVLVGISMGGYVAFRYWEAYASTVRGLVLVSTRSVPDTDETRRKRFESIEQIHRDGLTSFAEKTTASLLGPTVLESNSDLKMKLHRDVLAASPDAICSTLKGLASRPDSTDLLRRITVPTLVVSGNEDAIVSVSEMRTMAEQIPKSHFEVIRPAGHLVPLEKPTDFANQSLSFFKTL